MIVRLINIFFLVTFLLTSKVVAQQTGMVKGNVYDFETKEKLPGATIQLSTNLTKGAATDVEGHYVLELDTGYHQLICTYVGLKTYIFRYIYQKMWLLKKMFI